MEIIIPKRPRVLSSFLCRELLYEYLKEQLDSDRRMAVEMALESDNDLKEDLKKMKEALSYCHDLGQMNINEEFINELMTSSEQKSQNILKISWSILPEKTKWAIEAASVAAIVVAFSIYLPWESFLNFIPKDQPIKISNIGTELANGSSDSKATEPLETKDTQNVLTTNSLEDKLGTEGAQASDQNLKNSAESDLNYSEVDNVASAKEDPKKQDSKNLAVTNVQQVSQSPTKNPNTEPSDIAQNTVLVHPSEPTDNDQEAPEVASDVELKAKPILVGEKAALKGELFRAFMKLSAIDKNTAEFREKILSLGGQKAGEVQIGWRKPDGSYFHFSMEEAKLEELKQFMSSYGPVRFYKDPHWRVMPQGKIRIILWIEDSDLQK